MYGVTFNGKHSYNDFGLIMQSKNRPTLPEPKIVTEDMPGIDGEYDYSDVNPDAEVKYKSRTQEITFEFNRTKINCRDPRIVRQKARQIASWLAVGESRLIYDDEPDKFELAKVVNRLDLESQIVAGRPFTVQWSCRPFTYSLEDTSDDITLDSDLLLDIDLRLDDVFSFSVSGNTVVSINNIGSRKVKPIIVIIGTLSTLSIVVNGKAFTYVEAISGETLTIDNNLMQVTKGTTNKLAAMTGDFISLPTGINSVSITGTGMNFSIIFGFRPLYA